MHQRETLKKLFHSSSELWNLFLENEEELNTLYYPSAWEDLRPFVFSKEENLDFIGLDNTKNYEEPNLFIFSDYFPHSNSLFFDSRILHMDDYTSIIIDDYCIINPTDEYEYRINNEYIDLDPSSATGKAIFFKAKITSHRVKSEYFKYAIYFFYENVNLIEQLFLKNDFSFTHLVWKNDGSNLGGGNVPLNFIYHVAARCHTKFFFISGNYLDESNHLISNKSNSLECCPNEIREIIKYDEFEFFLEKKLTLNWEINDKVNFYIKALKVTDKT